MATEWTDELREEVKKAYIDKNPTPETSIECLKEVAEEFDKTVNGVRMVLSKAGVYVKKEATTSSTTTADKDTSKRVPKAESLASLCDIIAYNGGEVDNTIIDKLTGKAAQYFYNVIKTIVEKDNG